MDWLNYLILTQYDPEKHNGFPGHRWNPFNLPDHADPGPDIINPTILGPNSFGNWFMFAILVCAVLFGLAPRLMSVLIPAIIVAAMMVSVSGKYGYF